MTYAVWIALAVVFIAVLPAILRGKGGNSGSADSASSDGDSSDSDGADGGDGGGD